MTVIPSLPADLRRAVRRFVADPDLSRLAAGAPARHGQPVRRWRRRAVRRLSALRHRQRPGTKLALDAAFVQRRPRRTCWPAAACRTAQCRTAADRPRPRQAPAQPQRVAAGRVDAEAEQRRRILPGLLSALARSPPRSSTAAASRPTRSPTRRAGRRSPTSVSA